MKKGDLVLILGLLAVIGALFAVFWLPKKSGGGAAVVRIDGETVETLALGTDAEKRYESADGGYNVVTVKDGRVSVTAANCRDRICARHRPVSKNGECIVCLPHRLTVTVEQTAAPEGGVDAVA